MAITPLRPRRRPPPLTASANVPSACGSALTMSAPTRISAPNRSACSWAPAASVAPLTPWESPRSSRCARSFPPARPGPGGRARRFAGPPMTRIRGREPGRTGADHDDVVALVRRSGGRPARRSPPPESCSGPVPSAGRTGLDDIGPAPAAASRRRTGRRSARRPGRRARPAGGRRGPRRVTMHRCATPLPTSSARRQHRRRQAGAHRRHDGVRAAHVSRKSLDTSVNQAMLSPYNAVNPSPGIRT